LAYGVEQNIMLNSNHRCEWVMQIFETFF